MFAARRDVYAVRWENARTGRSGWMPAVRGGWRKGVAASSREYLPLTSDIVASHLTGDIDLGLYPLLDGDRCWWLAADFDGSAAMLDALSYLKAVRAVGAPGALEVSRSGQGAHAWLFFTSPVPAATADRSAPDCFAKPSRCAVGWICRAMTGFSPPRTCSRREASAT